MLFRIIFLNILATIAAHRQRRYLVYPDGGPARTQFIIGLGVPVDLKEASVTVGTVIKFQYDLPTNSSEYTSRIYGFANTVSRDMNGNEDTDDEKNNETNESKIIDTNNILEDDLDDENNTLVDITFSDRRKRSLLYTEGGAVYDNGIEGKELSLEEAIKRQETIDQNNLVEEEPQRMNRWDFYKILEHMAERYGYTGRPCLLRTICEAAEVPFTHENGLLAEIGHILFTPSTTKDTLSHHTDNEYHAAERLGREAGGSCESLFPECEGSILETFTGIGVDTLHKFGLFD
ncbi:uncharacterized protein LOC128676045 [Plodia interpunctella]|uniref:uncharacterized protein LOC128676045 n=1 Tax=Plodia interpunctella TaxID=58824 RepID=UPI0023674C60|nr:uncharacterized protein LOC128676045 [Plodia interpunctella]